ncbi:MAG: hypothetical protein ACK4IT_05620 [Thioalkalivibrionaceae bacterium]
MAVVAPRLIIATLTALLAGALIVAAIGAGDAPGARSPGGAPTIGVVAFGALAAWIAFGYGWARAAGAITWWQPIAVMLVPAAAIAALAASAWLSLATLMAGAAGLLWVASRFFKRDVLAAVMTLPMLSLFGTGALLALTLGVLPAR